MIKINDLIAALQEQQKAHGNIDIAIDMTLPRQELPKDGASKYYHMFGHWFLTGDTANSENRPVFEFHEDDAGDWLSVGFTGRIDGEVSELSRGELEFEAKRNHLAV